MRENPVSGGEKSSWGRAGKHTRWLVVGGIHATGMQKEGVVKNREFESQPQLFLAVCYWTSYLTSLCLIFLTCKVRIIIIPLAQSWPED